MLNPADYYGLSRYLAKKYYGLLCAVGRQGSLTVEDLQQAGDMALARAAREYDPARSQPKAFAYYRITYAIVGVIRQETKLSYNDIEKIKELIEAERRLELLLGRKPTVYELAEDLKVSVEEVEKILTLRQPKIISSEDRTPAEDNTRDRRRWEPIAPGPGPETIVEWEIDGKKLQQDFDTCLQEVMTPEERCAFILRWLNKEPGRVISSRLHLRPATAYRRSEDAMQKLIACLRAKGWDNISDPRK